MIEALRDYLKKRLMKNTYLYSILRMFYEKYFALYSLIYKKKWDANNKMFYRLLEEIGNQKEDFFFLQIGACDGIIFDPIYHLVKKYHWSGILIEPQIQEFEKLQKNYLGEKNLYFENIAISDKDEIATLYSLENKDDWQKGLATLFPDKLVSGKNLVTNTIRCVTINYILDKYKVCNIDLLLIDTEGYDYNIIKSINFTRIKPTIVRYEHVHIMASEYKELCDLFRTNGYLIFKEKTDTWCYSDVES